MATDPMRRPTTLLRVLKETGPVVAVVVAGLFLLGLAAPAAAQFFPFFGGGQPQRQAPRGGGGFFGGGDSPFFSPFQQQQPRRQAPREDFSRAPQSDKRDSLAERNVLVLGDAMADWLGYGLDEAYAEQPDMGVIRKHKTVSGLIRYQPKGEPADWAAAAKGILAQENPSAIVVMLGLQDRVSLREPAADKSGEKKPARAGKPDDKPDAELSDDDPADSSPIIAPERGSRTPTTGMVEFRDDRWVELYSKKIDEMIAVVKSKGVPVLWVGLPAVRGIKATSDMLFLNGLYRAAADRAGITYVDVWDGFVDEAGRFLQLGPDFEGQIRRLRSYDGVYFTKAGARKLAHYTEREITRLLASPNAPVTLPSETTGPEVEVKPDGPAPRPLAGPIIPLVVSSVGTDQLLGGPGARPVATDQLVSRTLVRGEPLVAPAGRADDAAWPRREVGREAAPRGGDMPVAASPDGAASGIAPVMAPAALPKAPRKIRPNNPIAQPQQPSFPSFFSFGGPQHPAPAQRPRPAPPGPRQQTGFGPSAGISGFFR
jgi:hypothetical protein